MSTKISIVTVTYNCESEIEKTIKSVVEQTYGDIEYLIIDGGSTDRTLFIIDKYKKYISKCISEPDKGIFDAMNKAIDLATGQWIIFMNAGDTFVDAAIVEQGFLDRRYNDNVGVIFGDAYFIKQNAKRLFQSQPFFLKKSKYREMGICHQAIFCRMDLAKIIKFDLKYKYAADYNMMMQIYKKGYTFYNLQFPIANYDLSGVSTNNSVSQFKEVASICDVSPHSILYFINYSFVLKRKLKKKIKNILKI